MRLIIARLAVAALAALVLTPPGQAQVNVTGMGPAGQTPAGAGTWPLLGGALDPSGNLQPLHEDGSGNLVTSGGGGGGGTSSTTTYPSTPPSNSPGTTGVPFYTSAAGLLECVLGGALPAGSSTIGAVTQAGGPWSENVTQINGSTISTGASGVQKVAVTGNAGATMDFAGQNATSPANALQVGAEFNTTPTTVSPGKSSPLQIDSSANLLVSDTGRAAAGSAPVGNPVYVGGSDGTDVRAIKTNASGNPLPCPSPQTSGGTSDSFVNSAATTNATSVKGSQGQLYSVFFANNGSGWAYVKLYNSASTPTAGSGTPFRVFGIPPGMSVAWSSSGGIGVALSAGIGYTITGGAANTDATAVAANQVVGDIEYE